MTHPQLIETMKRPDFYPHRPSDVEFIQTHISYVFIAGNFVYKVKKSLRFDFLDFTSLEQRKFYCEEEVRLNRRLAPDTYLGVETLSRDSRGDFILGDGADVMDYAVKMKKLPHDRMLKTLLDRGLVDGKTMDAIAGKIARFHLNADTGGHIDELGHIETIRRNHEENFAETGNYINRTIPDYQYRFIRDYVDRFLIARKALFEKRIADRKIRDCHGDLHLEHICVADAIIIFDCIEFNERFRYGDVARDVAFLTMDIDFNNHPQKADDFIRSYIKYSNDTDLLRLLNFYRCYCAYVRGKVTSFRLLENDISPAEREDISGKAKRYFDLAYTYAARLDKPVLILTTGLAGSGKSYQAAVIAVRLGADIIRTDIVRKALFNLKPTERRYDDFGTGIYTDDISGTVYETVLKQAAEKIRKGIPVIIDASFKKKAERQKAVHLAERLGVRYYVLACFCRDEITRERLESRARDNNNVSDGRWEIFQTQKDVYEKPEEIPQECLFNMDTCDDPESARQAIIKKIKMNDLDLQT